MSGPATLGLEGRLGFSITAPGSWYEIDVHPGTRDRNIRMLVEERVRGNEEMWAQRHAITRLLTEHAANAWDSGATYCAAFAIPTDDGPITGSVVVSLVRGPAGSGSQEDRAGHLSELFTPVPKRGGEGTPYTTVGTVEIPTCGPCARTWGIADIEIGDSTRRGTVRSVFMQTAIPVPGFNKVFLISANSPVVDLAEDLHDMFDAVTGTFRLVDLADAG